MTCRNDDVEADVSLFSGTYGTEDVRGAVSDIGGDLAYFMACDVVFRNCEYDVYGIFVSAFMFVLYSAIIACGQTCQ